MLAGSRVIQSGAAQSTVTVYLPIRKKAKEYQRFYSSGSFALHMPCAVPAIGDIKSKSNLFVNFLLF
ncbi:MAG TPA: hypothetical protein DDY31_09355 [Lachnospiraceae bacterium]|nr:hypothetical protein [Lachnospiraceae bacterium]